jgi:CTP:phosphocholine cytidylyltransferase-like protein
MNIIIPLGGRGERFSKNGYTQPKPLITIFEKSMIEKQHFGKNVFEETNKNINEIYTHLRISVSIHQYYINFI